MSWLKKVFSSQSSQETQVVNEKTREDNKEGGPQIKNLNIEEEAEKESSEGSQDSWFSFWSGLSTTFSLSKKRELSNDEEKKESKKWWSSFCSQKKKKSESVFSTQTSSGSSQSFSLSPMQMCVDKDDGWDDNESKKDDKKEENDDNDDDAKVEFFIKVGKHKKFKYFWFCF